jgi:hypothetical protein
VISVIAGVLWTFVAGGGFGVALVGLKVFPIVIIGGLDSVVGTIVGAMIVGVLESLGTGYLDPCGRRVWQCCLLCAASRYAHAATAWPFRAAEARARLRTARWAGLGRIEEVNNRARSESECQPSRLPLECAGKSR